MRYPNALPTAPSPLLCSVAAGVLALAMTGCGGGGSTPAPAPAAAAAPAPAAPSNSAPTINDAPISKAGSAQTGKAGDTITLDGSASSDINGDSLTYVWTLVSKPAASQASLTGANAVAPTFVADEPGDYVFSLVVNDGRANSEASSVTIAIAPKTWKDADCTQTGTALPACSRNFSDNFARAEMSTDGATKIVRLSTDTSAALALQDSPNNGVKGNKAVYALDFLHKVKLSEFPGISFAMKLNPDASGADTTILDDAYVTYTISLTCDNTGTWLNLTTLPFNMTKVVGADGYVTYSATRAQPSWNKSGDKPFPTSGTALINGALGSSSSPLSLDALIAAYPAACIYNWPRLDGGVTPAVVFNLSDKNNLKQKSFALKNIFIGDKRVF